MKKSAGFGGRQSAWPLVLAALGGFAASAAMPNASLADENGISFSLPGQFGGLAALRGVPGWSTATIYYHTSLAGSGAAHAAREVNIGRLSRTANLSLDVNGNGGADLQLVNATCVFATPVLGGQFALGMSLPLGYNNVSINGTLTTPLDATGSIDQLIDLLRGKHAVAAPGADLLFSNNFDMMIADVIDARHVGRGVIDGVECEHLAFRNHDTDWQFWIEVGTRPTAVIRDHHQGGHCCASVHAPHQGVANRGSGRHFCIQAAAQRQEGCIECT
jgi:hypothetical protein